MAAGATHLLGLECTSKFITPVGDSLEQPVGEFLRDEKSHLPGNDRCSLERAHQAAREKERMAWAFLQNSRVTSTSAVREQHLRDWLEAMRAMRELQLQLTASIVSTVTQGLRECVQAFASPAFEPLSRPVAWGPSHLAEQIRRVPQVNEKLRAHDGVFWRVESVANDLIEDGFFLVHIQIETDSGLPLDTIEIYSEDWPLYCLAYGLRLEPAGAPQAREASKLPSNTLTVPACS
jgi:hypothetical protein